MDTSKATDRNTDEELRLDVMEALQWDPSIASSDIQVAVKAGVVTLTGAVPFFADKWSAERATQRVEGVKAIAEELDVNLFGVHQRTDTDIAQAVVNALAWHVWVPSGTKATVEKGWVTLSGVAKWSFEREAAANAIRFLSGVKGISNDITLETNVKAGVVKAAIEKALERDAGICADHVKVATSGGKVTLTGTIHTWSERNDAGRAAWNAPGVTEVENDISVIYY